MNALRRIPQRWRSPHYSERSLDVLSGVLDTPPIRPARDGLALYAAIGSASLLPTLVALKSFHRAIGRGRVVLVDDGTLTAQDRAILAHHCGDPELVAAGQVERGPFPAGTGWALLLTVLGRRAGEYSIVLGPGTVTLGALPEIAQAIAANRSFSPSQDGEREPLPIVEFLSRSYPGATDDRTLQSAVESRLDRVPMERNWRYLRGSACCTGFAAGGPGRELAEVFLAMLGSLLAADRLSSPACLRTTANFLVANETAPIVLPQEACREFDGEEASAHAPMLHFASAMRFEDAYITRCRQAIAQLMAQAG